MKRFHIRAVLLAVNLLALSAAAQAQTHSAAHPASAVRENVSAEVRREVLEAVERWKQAVIGRDRAGLERAYHDDLTYGHTDGEVLGKTQQIDRTLAPDRSFPAIDITDVGVRVYGNVALVTAKIAFHVAASNGTQNVARLSGIDVWIKSVDGWRLLARQLTRPPQ